MENVLPYSKDWLTAEKTFLARSRVALAGGGDPKRQESVSFKMILAFS